MVLPHPVVDSPPLVVVLPAHRAAPVLLLVLPVEWLAEPLVAPVQTPPLQGEPPLEQ